MQALSWLLLSGALFGAQPAANGPPKEQPLDVEALVRQVSQLEEAEQQQWLYALEMRFRRANLMALRREEADRRNLEAARALRQKALSWDLVAAMIRETNQREQQAVAKLVRRYRSDVYTTFHSDRVEYERRLDALDRTLVLWAKSGRTYDQQAVLISWLDAAIRSAAKDAPLPLPPDPKFDAAAAAAIAKDGPKPDQPGLPKDKPPAPPKDKPAVPPKEEKPAPPKEEKPPKMDEPVPRPPRSDDEASAPTVSQGGLPVPATPAPPVGETPKPTPPVEPAPPPPTPSTPPPASETPKTPAAEPPKTPDAPPAAERPAAAIELPVPAAPKLSEPEPRSPPAETPSMAEAPAGQPARVVGQPPAELTAPRTETPDESPFVPETSAPQRPSPAAIAAVPTRQLPLPAPAAPAETPIARSAEAQPVARAPGAGAADPDSPPALPPVASPARQARTTPLPTNDTPGTAAALGRKPTAVGAEALPSPRAADEPAPVQVNVADLAARIAGNKIELRSLEAELDDDQRTWDAARLEKAVNRLQGIVQQRADLLTFYGLVHEQDRPRLGTIESPKTLFAQLGRRMFEVRTRVAANESLATEEREAEIGRLDALSQRLAKLAVQQP
jgi:hypothetical protein